MKITPQYQTFTTQTRLSLGEAQCAFLDDYASLFGQVKRRYTAKLQAGQLDGLKRKEIRAAVGGEGLAYRQFKGVESAVKGMVASRTTNNKNHIATLESKIKSTEVRLKKQLNRITSPRPMDDLAQLRFVYYQRQRRLDILRARLDKLRSQAPGDFSFCFGGKRLARERHELTDLVEIADWQRRWREARSDEIVLVGSSDESNGCQNCQLVADHLHVTVPDALKAQYGNSMALPATFRYYAGQLATTTGPRSYRFKRRNGHWYVFVTFRHEVVEQITCRSIGALGVDLNADHLAVTYISGDGNYRECFTVPLPLRGKNQAQRALVIGEAVKRCVEFAGRKGVPVVVEDLDFTRKKRALDKAAPEQARMLSALAYGQCQQYFASRCYRSGVELIKVNPAYTSQLGELKYQARYGLTRHHGAAMVIARRGLGFRERKPKHILQFNGGRVRLHASQELMKDGEGVGPKVVMDIAKRALKARSGLVLRGVACAAPYGISRRRLSGMLCHHVQPGSRDQYLPWLTKLGIASAA